MNNLDKLLVCLTLIFFAITVINFFLILTGIQAKITGVYLAYGRLSFEITSACTIQLLPGWNLISICANVSNTSIQHVLMPIKNNYRYVMLWNESTQAFDVFSPRAMSPPFDSFEFNKSYLILYTPNQSGRLGISGKELNDMNISMVYGWNSPSWPYMFTVNVTKYLDTIAGKYRYMFKWNASSQAFEVFSPRAATNPFSTISMGEGQFILVNYILGALLQYNKTALRN